MKCCICEAPAVASFGVAESAAERYPEAKRTYYAYGERETLLSFCRAHFEAAALTWPGLIGNPVQPVHRRKEAGIDAIEAVRHRLEDPAVRRKVLMLWRKAARDDPSIRPKPKLRQRTRPRTASEIERRMRLLKNVRGLLMRGA
jgi:hypothetical protein